LGLFLLVVNAATLWITARICEFLGLGFVIQDFTTALIGSILISIISWLLSIFLIGDNERGRK
jgi:putative membrane protein